MVAARAAIPAAAPRVVTTKVEIAAASSTELTRAKRLNPKWKGDWQSMPVLFIIDMGHT
jgi:hypothetical protein